MSGHTWQVSITCRLQCWVRLFDAAYAAPSGTTKAYQQGGGLRLIAFCPSAKVGSIFNNRMLKCSD